MSALCEWSPEHGRARYENEPCFNTATLIVGANGQWRLCQSCAALPAHNRYRVRIPTAGAGQ